ncbi:MAG: flagellar basal-body rod protein FlgG [Planctomycetes bacterium]|nr:flagellar basal-body rod protein FlgG [Planctomycetota bacterium]
MSRALNTAASGMSAMQMYVDVTANNLANVQTTGFKRDRADFSDLIYQELRRSGTLTPTQNRTPIGIQIGNGVQPTGVSKEFEMGPPVQTGGQLDWMIQGEGFFQVELQNGLIGYTRNGTFFRDGQGQVVTAEGYKLNPNIQISDETVRVQMGRDGNLISFNDQGLEVGSQQINLARCINPQGLTAIGDNLYVSNPEATGQMITGAPGTTGFGVILGGFLEASNVDVVKSMVDLIKGQRAYEFNSKAVRASDEMLRQAANLA